VKYAPEGTPIRISALSNISGVEVVVANATGAHQPDPDRLFERFYRADGGRSREAGGTGLGLAIVKHLVQAQGGQVGVESGRGGSRFWVRLPVAT